MIDGIFYNTTKYQIIIIFIDSKTGWIWLLTTQSYDYTVWGEYLMLGKPYQGEGGDPRPDEKPATDEKIKLDKTVRTRIGHLRNDNF